MFDLPEVAPPVGEGAAFHLQSEENQPGVGVALPAAVFLWLGASLPAPWRVGAGRPARAWLGRKRWCGGSRGAGASPGEGGALAAVWSTKRRRNPGTGANSTGKGPFSQAPHERCL